MKAKLQSVCATGTASALYYSCGFFGAARFGHDAVAKGNILDNNLGAGLLQGILNIMFACAALPSIKWQQTDEFCTLCLAAIAA